MRKVSNKNEKKRYNMYQLEDKLDLKGAHLMNISTFFLFRYFVVVYVPSPYRQKSIDSEKIMRICYSKCFKANYGKFEKRKNAKRKDKRVCHNAIKFSFHCGKFSGRKLLYLFPLLLHALIFAVTQT